MRSLSQSADVISCIDNQSHSLIAIYLQKGTHTAQLKFQWKATPQCFPNFLMYVYSYTLITQFSIQYYYYIFLKLKTTLEKKQ